MHYSIDRINSLFLKHFRQRGSVQYDMRKRSPLSSKSISVHSASVYIVSRYVIANDLSPAAVNIMKRNVAVNGLTVGANGSESSTAQAKVQVNEGDAW